MASEVLDTARERQVGLLAQPERARPDLAALKVFSTDAITDVEACWRALEDHGLESPGLSYDFVKTWVETFAIPRSEQKFCVAKIDGKPLALLALHRQSRFGADILTSFAGTHVGCHSPLMDREMLFALTPSERQAVWQQIRLALGDADLLHIPHVMTDDVAYKGLGTFLAEDTLYRSAFSSWAQCDAEQRSRSRRKHDKQQAAKLAGMGDVQFETLQAGDEVAPILDIMFEDRAKRFAQQGIADPFADPQTRAFYRTVFSSGRNLTGLLQVLRLDGRVVATRFNLKSGQRVFCLISSMATDPELAPGSPGKQILVHAMRDMFDGDVAVFDMGAGFTDEKRHWCNQQLPLSQVFAPLTLKGRALAQVWIVKSKIKAAVKANQGLLSLFKNLRRKFS